MIKNYSVFILALSLLTLVSFTVDKNASTAGSGNGVAFSTGTIEGHKLGQGERPPVDLSVVPEDAYEPGKIRVKFRTLMENKLRNTMISKGPAGYVSISQEGIDNLNRRFGVSQYKAMLHELYRREAPTQEQRQRHRLNGLHLWYELSLGSQAAVKNVVEAFSHMPEVETAEPVYRIRLIEPASKQVINGTVKSAAAPEAVWAPNDPYYAVYQWGFNNTGQNIQGIIGTPGADIEAQGAWATLKGNPAVIVAVIDQGFQYNHPDLQANVWPGIGPDGTNTLAGDHGTHVAGTIAAVSNNGVGVAGTAGGDGTPGTGVKVMSLDIFNGSHGMNNLELNVWAADRGAAISQNSWGYTLPGVYNQVDLDGIDYFNQYGGGGILTGGITIFAAGNDNSSGNWYPAYYSATVAVAATDNKDIRSSFSNYGTWVDLAAPGTNIASLGGASDYYWMSGTSMACPHVSGVAALVLSYVPGKMTNQQLFDLLKASCENIDATNPNYIGLLGSGRINARKAIELAAQYLGVSVEKPGTFTASAVSDEAINLNWTPNSSGDPVLVAWSANGTFGTPVNGTEYTAGGVLPGGGTVLYSGNGDSFTHSGLNYATTYYYRIWSNSGTAYSAYLNAQATTWCLVVKEFPYTENFTGRTTIPPCWENGGTAQWNVGTFTSGLTSTDGYYAWTEIKGKTAMYAQLTSPSFNFTGQSNVQLAFKHRYNHDRSSATISYSVNGGAWTPVISWTANTGTASFSQLLNTLDGKPDVRFRWTLNYTGGGLPNSKRSWSIDDIAVTASSQVPQYTITASARTGGTINPSGSVQVASGASQTFTITPNSGYEIADVLVDGSSAGKVTSYTFPDVAADHTISASFIETSPEPCLVSTLSYIQNFNASTSLPACWLTQGTAWIIGTNVKGGLTGTDGNYAYTTMRGKTPSFSELISTAFNFGNYTGITISFKHYYIDNTSTASFMFSTDGGASWSSLETWNATTSNGATFSTTFNNPTGSPNVLFKWVLINEGGGAANSTRSWFIDDVDISPTNAAQAGVKKAITPAPEAGRMFRVYPNPFAERLYFEFASPVKTNARIDIFDITGRMVSTVFDQQVESGITYRVEFKPAAPAGIMYFYRMSVGNQVYNGKVICQK